MRLLLLAMGGGALGAGARHLVNVATLYILGPRAAPLATLGINVLGSFLMGVVVALALTRVGDASVFRTFLATGILGGFTTFSAFSLDTVTLGQTSSGSAAAYVLASVVLSVLALLAGFAVARGAAP